MATTNRERVGLALDLLKAGLMPFVAREFVARYKGRGKQNWNRFSNWRRIFSHPTGAETGRSIQMDVTCAAKASCGSRGMKSLSLTLGHAERSLVSELQEFATLGTPGTVLRR